MDPLIIEQHFQDWCRLLKQAKAEDLLEDPEAVWIEAWHQCEAVMVGRLGYVRKDTLE